MLFDATRRKIENIVRGVVIDGQTDHCTTTRNFLCTSYSTSKTVKRDFESKLVVKKEQENRLKQFADQHHLWLKNIPGQDQYITRGGESRVYLDTDRRHVIKINDASYYATWLEYFNSLVLHNTIFDDTAYALMGFVLENNHLMSVVRQPYIVADGQADLQHIKVFLYYNGFRSTRRQDYFNDEYGLILEDMHDENVIVNQGKLFFIDTVFYTVDPNRVAFR